MGDWIIGSILAASGGILPLLAWVIRSQGREIRRLHQAHVNVFRDNDTLTEAGWRTEVCAWMFDAATYYRDEADDPNGDVGDRLYASLKAATIMEMVNGVSKGKYKAEKARA